MGSVLACGAGGARDRGLGRSRARRTRWPSPRRAPTWPSTTGARSTGPASESARWAGARRRLPATSPTPWCPSRLVREALCGPRRARHRRQQCRNHPARARRRDERPGLARGDRRQPELGVPDVPGRRPPHARPGARQDRQRRLAARVPGRDPGPRLRRVQGRRRAAHQGARQRVGRQGGQRERDRSRLRAHRQHGAAAGRPGAQQAIVDRIPAGRWAETGDIAGGVVFLCSPASDYVHGHVLVVDGGWLAR